MNRPWHANLTGLLILVLVATGWCAESDGDEDWIQLFNGKNLDGWKVKIQGYELNENFGNTFRVEDGLLKVAYDQYDAFDRRFGHIFFDRAFSNYMIRVEYRFVGQQVPGGPEWAIRNSGIMLHGQAPETMRKDQNFPVSVEVQLLGGDGSRERSTANVCTPGTHIVMDDQLVKRHCNPSRSKTYHGDQWVTAEVEVRGGGVIKHVIDGEVVLQYSQPQLDPSDADAERLVRNSQTLLTGGFISLQSESHPIEFRKVEVKVLDPTDRPAPGLQVEQLLRIANAEAVPYLLYLPRKYESSDAWPLVFFLHGRGESRGPLSLVKKWGPPRLLDQGHDMPYVVVSPQCPENDRWTSETQQAALIQLLDFVCEKYAVDKARVYLTGLSMGGYGTWRLAADHPTRFAAAAPICGGGKPEDAERLKSLPIWVFHGNMDQAVPLARSAEMVEAIEKAGGKKIRFSTLEHVGHNSWSAAYATPELYSWFDQQRASQN